MFVEFAIAVVILTVLWLVVKVAMAVPGFGAAEIKTTGVFQQAEFSSVCDYWLMNFLRADSAYGMENSDLLAYASESATYKTYFENEAANYFKANYRRPLPLARWALSAETSAYIPVVKLGYKDHALAQTCAQKIPSAKGPITVTLGVDY